MDLSGPSFVTLLVSNLDMSEKFYKDKLGFPLSKMQPRGNARAFDTKPCGLVLRMTAMESPKPMTPGEGILLWLYTSNSKVLHDQLKASGTKIAVGLGESPFGRTFSIQDPDGYVLGVYDGA